MRNFIERILFPIKYPLNFNDNIKCIENTKIQTLFYNGTKSPYTILYSHGNAELLDDIDPFLRGLRDMTGMSVLGYEYPEDATAETTKKTIEMVYEYLEMHNERENIILVGRSIGSGPTMHMAHKLENLGHRVHSVVLISPLASVKRCVTQSKILMCGLGHLFSYCVGERFNNDEIVEKLRCPLLLIHGETDDVLPYHMSQELWHRYGGERENVKLSLVKGKDHNTIATATIVAQEIVAFENGLKLKK